MKWLALIIVTFPILCQGQSKSKSFIDVYKKISKEKFINLDSTKPNFEENKKAINELQKLVDFYHDFTETERKLNGKAGFQFAGNDSSLDDLFKIGVSGKIDKGAYPYEMDFSMNVQTTIQNGSFQENLSDIDVSVDFHPWVPHGNEKGDDGLWLENYVFIKRFNNNFLGIEQRYEAGAGFIFNHYSKKLTKKGKINREGLNKIPKTDVHAKSLSMCLDSCYIAQNLLKIDTTDAKIITKTRDNYIRSNIKKYSRLRIAMLVGFYYELEKAIAKDSILFNGERQLVSQSFDATNKLRWELRPTLVWQPKDGLQFKVYPYFKLPIGQTNARIEEGDLKSSEYDFFLDWMNSIEYSLDGNLTVSLNYRLFYDNAPKRRFLEQNDGSFVLLSGQKRHSNFGIKLEFKF